VVVAVDPCFLDGFHFFMNYFQELMFILTPIIIADVPSLFFVVSDIGCSNKMNDNTYDINMFS
jgi:hypothetical protein